jgi:hypothetical protein
MAVGGSTHLAAEHAPHARVDPLEEGDLYPPPPTPRVRSGEVAVAAAARGEGDV